MLYLTEKNDVLCADCARRIHIDESVTMHSSTYDEGATLYCDECNAPIEASYGDPDEDEQ